MRNVCYSVAASLDGFIAGPNGEYDWIVMDPAIDFRALFARFDTVLMGRKTYAQAGGHGSGGGMRTFVFSRTLRAEEHRGVTVVADEAVPVVQKLRSETGKEIWLFGGGVLAASLFEAGQVDTVEVGVIPVLLGSGIPLVSALPGNVRLKLTDTQTFPSGTVFLKYDVDRSPPAKPGRKRR
jgi:dihydrofolate reductase